MNDFVADLLISIGCLLGILYYSVVVCISILKKYVYPGESII